MESYKKGMKFISTIRDMKETVVLLSEEVTGFGSSNSPSDLTLPGKYKDTTTLNLYRYSDLSGYLPPVAVSNRISKMSFEIPSCHSMQSKRRSSYIVTSSVNCWLRPRKGGRQTVRKAKPAMKVTYPRVFQCFLKKNSNQSY